MHILVGIHKDEICNKILYVCCRVLRNHEEKVVTFNGRQGEQVQKCHTQETGLEWGGWVSGEGEIKIFQ